MLVIFLFITLFSPDTSTGAVWKPAGCDFVVDRSLPDLRARGGAVDREPGRFDRRRHESASYAPAVNRSSVSRSSRRSKSEIGMRSTA